MLSIENARHIYMVYIYIYTDEQGHLPLMELYFFMQLISFPVQNIKEREILQYM